MRWFTECNAYLVHKVHVNGAFLHRLKTALILLINNGNNTNNALPKDCLKPLE